jgi:Putative transposase DNA-binding domain
MVASTALSVPQAKMAGDGYSPSMHHDEAARGGDRMKVTRIAYSRDLNPGKFAQLAEQARRLGRVRSLVWQRYGSVGGARMSSRQIRDRWMADGTAATFEVLANPWKETVRDATDNIHACREAAKVQVRRAICRRTTDRVERRRLYSLLQADRWREDPYLSRQMRKHWLRGHNHIANQIVVRSDDYRVFKRSADADVWLAVPGLQRRCTVRIPLNTRVAPMGTLRLILRDSQVEVHYQVEAATLTSAQRQCGTETIGIDRGYREVCTDSAGRRYGTGLGGLLTVESDRLRVRNARRAKLRSIAEKAAKAGDQARADRIRLRNLGQAKYRRQRARAREAIRAETYTAINELVSNAKVIAAEDLTRPVIGRSCGRAWNRRLAAWTKGITAQALRDVSDRRGSVVIVVNAAYTSQTDSRNGTFGRRRGRTFHCYDGVVLDADHNAAANVLRRMSDPDITLWTPYQQVRQIIVARTRSHRLRLPSQDSSPLVSAGGERIIQDCSATSNA